MKPKEETLWHQSGVNREGKPLVQLVKGDRILGQMTPFECRQHAIAALECAEAAETDAFLFEFLRGNGFSPEEISVILVRFRDFRHDQGKLTGPRKPEDFTTKTDFA